VQAPLPLFWGWARPRNIRWTCDSKPPRRSRGGFSRFSEPMCTAVVRYWPKAAELGGASSGGYLGYTGRAANVVATAAHDPQRTWGGFSDHPAVHWCAREAVVRIRQSNARRRSRWLSLPTFFAIQLASPCARVARAKCRASGANSCGTSPAEKAAAPRTSKWYGPAFIPQLRFRRCAEAWRIVRRTRFGRSGFFTVRISFRALVQRRPERCRLLAAGRSQGGFP